MGALAARKTTVDGLSARKRRLIRLVLSRLELGQPATFTAPGGITWYVWDDPRLGLEHVARVGCFAGLVASIDDSNIDPDGLSREEIETRIRQAIAARYVSPDGYTFTTEDPWQEILTANQAPAAVRGGASVPDTWTAT